MMSRGGRGYSRGSSRGSYRGGYRGSDHGSSYNGRDGSRNRYSGGGGDYNDSRSSRYDNRYSRQDNRQGGYKRNDYKDSRDRRSPDRKRPRTDHSSQGRRDYGTGGTDYHRRDSSGTSGRGGSSSRYHDGGGSSSYDKRGNDHHSSSAGGGSGGGIGRDRYENRSSSRGRGSSGGDRPRETMGPPRSLGPRNTNIRGPPMRSPMNSRPMSTLSMRRGTMRGRLNTRFRNDIRRGGIMTNRFNNRRDLRPPPMRRRFPPIRGGRDGIGRIGKRTLDATRVSRKALIKRALAAAKDLDDDEHTTENEAEDDEEADEDKDTTGADVEDCKKELKEGDDDDGDKTEKEEDDDDDNEADKSGAKGDEKEDDEKADESKGDDDASAGDKKDESASPKKAKKVVKAKEEKSEDKEIEKKRKDTKITTKYRTSSYIKLNCCHCGTKCVTFKEYQSHLFRGLHRAAMRRLAGKTRDRLMEMRQAQRVAQKEEDEKMEDASEQKSSYCPLCQLNFRQPKVVHQKSDGHKEMKRFLMPYCVTCKIGFKSPMAYEAHRASLEHLKFKARVERYANKDDSGEDAGAEIDLENFTTVDEVGDVDDLETGKDNLSTPKKSSVDNRSIGQPGTDDEDDESDDVDEETVIGEEHVKKVEVQYCDLCHMYLPRREEPEKILKMHCKTRSHLKLYIRNREDKKLRERAERIHKKKLTDAKAKKDAAKGTKDASEADSAEKLDAKVEKTKADGTSKDGTTDEQMWEVVDNDLGDLLREVAKPTEDAEEEEDDEKTSSERYDKFKHTEKNGLDQSNIHVDEDDVEKKAVKKAPNGDTITAEKEVKAEA